MIRRKDLANREDHLLDAEYDDDGDSDIHERALAVANSPGDGQLLERRSPQELLANMTREVAMLADPSKTPENKGLNEVAAALVDQWKLLTSERKEAVFMRQLYKDKIALQKEIMDITKQKEALEERLADSRNKSNQSVIEKEDEWMTEKAELLKRLDVITSQRDELIRKHMEDESMSRLEQLHKEESQSLKRQIATLERALEDERARSSKRPAASGKGKRPAQQEEKEDYNVDMSDPAKLQAHLARVVEDIAALTTKLKEDSVKTKDEVMITSDAVSKAEESITNTVDALRAKVTELKNYILKLKKRISDLVEKLKALENTEAPEYKALQSALQAARDELEAQKARLKESEEEWMMERVKLEQGRDYLRERIATLQNTMVSLVENLESMERRAASLAASGMRPPETRSIGTSTTMTLMDKEGEAKKPRPQTAAVVTRGRLKDTGSTTPRQRSKSNTSDTQSEPDRDQRRSSLKKSGPVKKWRY